jgi:predicted nucleic acid-binding protein
VEALVTDDPEMIAWWASPVECGSAVHRLRREGTFGAEEAAQVLTALTAAFDAANVVQPGDDVAATALRLLAVHPLRAGDALQLAAALVWAQGSRPGGREFVCLDDRLRTAATLEGFHVVPVVAPDVP